MVEFKTNGSTWPRSKCNHSIYSVYHSANLVYDVTFMLISLAIKSAGLTEIVAEYEHARILAWYLFLITEWSANSLGMLHTVCISTLTLFRRSVPRRFLSGIWFIKHYKIVNSSMAQIELLNCKFFRVLQSWRSNLTSL